MHPSCGNAVAQQDNPVARSRHHRGIRRNRSHDSRLLVPSLTATTGWLAFPMPTARWRGGPRLRRQCRARPLPRPSCIFRRSPRGGAGELTLAIRWSYGSARESLMCSYDHDSANRLPRSSLAGAHVDDVVDVPNSRQDSAAMALDRRRDGDEHRHARCLHQHRSHRR